MKALILGAAILLAACQSTPAAPNGPAVAFGTPFMVDGWYITLVSLQPVEKVRPDIQSLAGTEMWVLAINASNETGSEASAGTGYRLEGANGDIVDANLLSIVDPVFGADLAAGGHTSGDLTFNLAIGDAPVYVLVAPGSDSVQVPVARSTVAPSAAPTPALTPTPATTSAPTPTPEPTPTPASLVFATEIHYGTLTCAGNGYAYTPFTIKVVNKGGSKSDYVWFKIGDLGALAGAKLNGANWASGEYLWDESIFSNSLGYLFVRGPQIKAHQSVTLKFNVQTIAFAGLSQYDVVAFTGPATITSEADLTATGTDYGPLSTTIQFC